MLRRRREGFYTVGEQGPPGGALPPAMPPGHDPRAGHPIPSLYGTRRRKVGTPFRRRLSGFILRYRVHWAVISLLFYGLALVFVLIVFPDVSNTWVTLILLASGFANTVASLGSLLVGS